jgi:hypothetical protein
MANRVLFRIENPVTGDGIYRVDPVSPKFFRGAVLPECSIRPSPYDDEPLTETALKHRRRLDRFDENVRILFAFPSPEALERWFSIDERQDIEQQGFSKGVPIAIAVLTIDSRFVGDMKAQCTFDAIGKPNLIAHVPVTTDVVELRKMKELWK